MTELSDSPQITYRLGLPEAHRQTAAELYGQAFERKLVPLLGRARMTALLAHALDPSFAFAALQGGQLLGVAGFQLVSGGFVCLKRHHFRQLYPPIVGELRYQAARTLERPHEPGTLLMDGIAVASAARGRGVGTGLLGAIKGYAAERGFGRVRLDVVNTNPKARRLYERLGFEAVDTQDLTLLRSILGFSAVTTMVWRVGTEA